MDNINYEELLKAAEKCIQQINDILAWDGLSKKDRMFYLGRKANKEYTAQLIRELMLGDYIDEADRVRKFNLCGELVSEDLQKMKARFSKELELDEEE